VSGRPLIHVDRDRVEGLPDKDSIRDLAYHGSLDRINLPIRGVAVAQRSVRPAGLRGLLADSTDTLALLL
jgi:hypothetical protein